MKKFFEKVFWFLYIVGLFSFPIYKAFINPKSPIEDFGSLMIALGLFILYFIGWGFFYAPSCWILFSPIILKGDDAKDMRYGCHYPILALVVFLLVTIVYNKCQNNTKDEQLSKVWICTGRSSHAYHLTDDCYGIKACRGKKKEVTLGTALSMGRTPCHYCHDSSDNTKNNLECNGWDVFICTGGLTYKYHRSPDCNEIRHFSKRVIRVDPEEAEDYGYEPCEECCD